MRGVRSIAFVALTAMFLACGGGGDGGGGGPTAPPPVPQVAGNWTGVWMADGFPFDVELSINQSGSNLTGTFALLGGEIPITGTVSSALMTWQFSGTDCATLTGSASILSQAPTTMNGTIDLNFLQCPDDPDRFFGPVTWTRAAAGSKQGRPSTLKELTAALAERRK